VQKSLIKLAAIYVCLEMVAKEFHGSDKNIKLQSVADLGSLILGCAMGT